MSTLATEEKGVVRKTRAVAPTTRPVKGLSNNAANEGHRQVEQACHGEEHDKITHEERRNMVLPDLFALHQR